MNTSNAVDANLEHRVEKTFCRICLASCGLDVETDGKTIFRIGPDKDHPNNWKDFCSKGGSANQLIDHAKRLRQPMKRVGDKYVEATYEEAVEDIAKRLNLIRNRHGANSIATYLGNPGAHNQPGTIAQSGFMKAIKSNNAYYVGSLDTNNLQLSVEKCTVLKWRFLSPMWIMQIVSCFWG
ncbi:molybdopterin-dependent oxidoreductase [Zhongshania marina]|jgi:formate dehydrogenase|uniref:4Fe-4S Mo/W bis-MGD-type domain-containing protein n=1 Tax=Zhongshania marina TaxID=2304603 RepID=A0A2S4HIU9_9GAMM|nr:molybdopterin-dependent oxidoreductase [Marortus luteolus]POP53922.1 hypothetical protein C0068_04860 [Marortus luteolus]